MPKKHCDSSCSSSSSSSCCEIKAPSETSEGIEKPGSFMFSSSSSSSSGSDCSSWSGSSSDRRKKGCKGCGKSKSKCGCKASSSSSTSTRKCGKCGKSKCSCGKKEHKGCKSCGKSKCSGCEVKNNTCSKCYHSPCSCAKEEDPVAKWNKAQKKSYEKKKGKKGGKVYVSLVRNSCHPNSERICDSQFVYAIDGVQGKTLRVKRGYKYLFVFEKCEHQLPLGAQYKFLLTKDPAGGGVSISCSPNYTPEPLCNTSSISECEYLYVKIPKDCKEWPDVVYYQDFFHSFIGGVIITNK